MLWLGFLAAVTTVYGDARVHRRDFDYVAPAYVPHGIFRMGTPPQKMMCVFDVGFSDALTVDASDYDGPFVVNRYNPSPNVGRVYGQLSRVVLTGDIPTYKMDHSTSTSSNTTQGVSVPFVWNEYERVQGVWISEVAAVANPAKSVSPVVVTLGVFDNKNGTHCVIGLGPTNGEIAGTTFENHLVTPQYPNIVETLYSLGTINTRSYSIWFSPKDNKGAIIFGGSDTLKFTGYLTTVPIVSYVIDGNQASEIPGAILTTRIMFHGLSVFYDHSLRDSANTTNSTTSPDTPGGSNWTVALTTHTSSTIDLSTLELFSRLPSEIVHGIGSTLGLHWIEELGLYGCSCNAQGILRFNMSGFLGTMPLKDILVPTSSLNITHWRTNDYSDLCLMTLIPTRNSFVLGNGVLRNLYTLVDFSLYTVSFAQLNSSMNVDESDLMAHDLDKISNSMVKAPQQAATTLHHAVEATFHVPSAMVNTNVTVVNSGSRLVAMPQGVWAVCLLAMLLVH